jgi:hypothetical protein
MWFLANDGEIDLANLKEIFFLHTNGEELGLYWFLKTRNYQFFKISLFTLPFNQIFLHPDVCRKAHVLFMLFEFVCIQWCPTHNVLYFLFCLSLSEHRFYAEIKTDIYIYNIGVLTVNIEFMWGGLETGERWALATIRFVPSHINSIFTVNIYYDSVKITLFTLA